MCGGVTERDWEREEKREKAVVNAWEQLQIELMKWLNDYEKWIGKEIKKIL